MKEELEKLSEEAVETHSREMKREACDVLDWHKDTSTSLNPRIQANVFALPILDCMCCDASGKFFGVAGSYQNGKGPT